MGCAQDYATGAVEGNMERRADQFQSMLAALGPSFVKVPSPHPHNPTPHLTHPTAPTRALLPVHAQTWPGPAKRCVASVPEGVAISLG